MTIVTWNCNMAFRKKAQLLMRYNPDILVIPECECLEKLVFPNEVPVPGSAVWYGDNPNKGLGIFAYGGLKLKRRRIHDSRFRFIVPVSVVGNGLELSLYAVWANNPKDPEGTYVEQVWKAINVYKKHIRKKQTILLGDFNSNTIWDRKYRKGNHSHVVEFLDKKGIKSAYHAHHAKVQGKEEHPTLYMYRHLDKPYHLDYCFLSNDLRARIVNVEVGSYDEWSAYSDHVPLIITLASGTRNEQNVNSNKE
ncbi:MAG: endonuclease/exonuclease/phosphatase family protein [Chitinophagaceae bacterium]|nr:endonuclease/exonuclease/phosphatase family protein [Chitinophagaceae bacterium]